MCVCVCVVLDAEGLVVAVLLVGARCYEAGKGFATTSFLLLSCLWSMLLSLTQRRMDRKENPSIGVSERKDELNPWIAAAGGAGNQGLSGPQGPTGTPGTPGPPVPKP